MMVGGELALGGSLRGRWKRKRRLMEDEVEREMTMVALIEGLDQVEPAGCECRCDLRMRYSRPPHDVDRSSEQVITVRNTADSAVMFGRSEGACDDSERRRDPHRRGCNGLYGLRVTPRFRRIRRSRCANEEQRPKIPVPIPHISLPQQEIV
jgi:hypothetical protein